ncbi:MAG: twin-arginine translocase subunit TatC [Candidatus Zixiibacteriota bacterium]
MIMAETKAKGEMTFLDHLEELRRRMIKSMIVVILFAAVAYYFSPFLVDAMSKPLTDVGVFFKAPQEAFITHIKVAFFAGAIAAIPVVFYQIWMFIGPGLLKSEIKIVIPIVISSTIFFAIGGGFCFFFVIPLAIKFLLGFATDNMKPMIMIGDYISFVGALVLAFGIVFELPVASFILGRLGVIDHKMLSKGRRYAIVGIFVLAAFLTPPDVVSQVLLACPLYLLYELSILVVWLTGKKRRQEASPYQE